jgi:hypothetical protein
MLIAGTYKLKSRKNNFIAQRLTSFCRAGRAAKGLRASAVNKKIKWK